MPHTAPPLLIGVSARIYYPSTPVFDLGGVWTKTLHYLEQSVAQWLTAGGALPVMIPGFESHSLVQRQNMQLKSYAKSLDGLLLQGGNDVAPQSYGEQPLRPEWAGDPVRDRYEMDLIEAFLAEGKPIFGICRGLQILNVAFGGTLYQDLPTQCPEGAVHFSPRHYEGNFHPLHIEPGGWLERLYPGQVDLVVNSIHHQAIKELAAGFRMEAHCPQDGIVEAVSRAGGSFVAGVQWHPEFHNGHTQAKTLFDDTPMLESFLHACRALRAAETAPQS